MTNNTITIVDTIYSENSSEITPLHRWSDFHKYSSNEHIKKYNLFTGSTYDWWEPNNCFDLALKHKYYDFKTADDLNRFITEVEIGIKNVVEPYIGETITIVVSKEDDNDVMKLIETILSKYCKFNKFVYDISYEEVLPSKATELMSYRTEVADINRKLHTNIPYNDCVLVDYRNLNDNDRVIIDNYYKTNRNKDIRTLYSLCRDRVVIHFTPNQTFSYASRAFVNTVNLNFAPKEIIDFHFYEVIRKKRISYKNLKRCSQSVKYLNEDLYNRCWKHKSFVFYIDEDTYLGYVYLKDSSEFSKQYDGNGYQLLSFDAISELDEEDYNWIAWKICAITTHINYGKYRKYIWWYKDADKTGKLHTYASQCSDIKLEEHGDKYIGIVEFADPDSDYIKQMMLTKKENQTRIV